MKDDKHVINELHRCITRAKEYLDRSPDTFCGYAFIMQFSDGDYIIDYDTDFRNLAGLMGLVLSMTNLMVQQHNQTQEDLYGTDAEEQEEIPMTSSKKPPKLH